MATAITMVVPGHRSGNDGSHDRGVQPLDVAWLPRQ